jgi:hypothetical protein
MMAHLVKHRFKIIFIWLTQSESDLQWLQVIQHKLMIFADLYGIPFDALLFRSSVPCDLWIRKAARNSKEIFQEVFELNREWPMPTQLIAQNHGLLWNLFRDEEGCMASNAPWLSWSWDWYLAPSPAMPVGDIATVIPDNTQWTVESSRGRSRVVPVYKPVTLKLLSQATSWSEIPRDILWNSMGVSEAHELYRCRHGVC